MGSKNIDISVAPQNPLEQAGLHPHTMFDLDCAMISDLAGIIVRTRFLMEHPDRVGQTAQANRSSSDLSELMAILKSEENIPFFIEDLRAEGRLFLEKIDLAIAAFDSMSTLAVENAGAFGRLIADSVDKTGNSILALQSREVVLLPIGVRSKLAGNPSAEMLMRARADDPTYETIPEDVCENLRLEVLSDFERSSGQQELDALIQTTLKQEMPEIARRYAKEKASPDETKRLEDRSKELEQELLDQLLPESVIQERVLEKYLIARPYLSKESREDPSEIGDSREFSEAADAEVQRYAKIVTAQDGMMQDGARSAKIIGICLGTPASLAQKLGSIFTRDPNLSEFGLNGLPISTLGALMKEMVLHFDTSLLNSTSWNEVQCDNHFLITVETNQHGRAVLNIEGEVQAVRESPPPARAPRARKPR